MADRKKKQQLVLVVEGTAALAPHWPTILEDYLSKLIRACMFAPLFPSLSELIMGILAFRIIGSDQITQINGEFTKVHSTEAATPYVELALVVFNAPGSYSLMGFCELPIAEGLAEGLKTFYIAPVAIIDRQLPFEYTIASRSTDVMVMAYPVQNINHSAFRSMFEREKLSGNNFNDWFRQLKLVLRVEKKMYVIEQPIPPAPAADSAANVLAEWNAVYDAHNEVACLMLGSMTPELHRQFENSSPYEMLQELKSMFEKQAGVERFDLIQTFHACKQEEGKPVGQYVLKMKGYVEQLECLWVMCLPRESKC
ncbi:zinc finger, CCHC-type containing protein [Tanacetum coccineum]